VWDRVRILGQHYCSQIIALAAAEGLACFAAPYLAAALRFDDGITDAEAALGPLWPQGLTFAAAMFVSMLSVGLYSARQRAGTAGTIARLGASVLGAFVILALIYYLVPDMRLGRGVLGLTMLISFLACLLVRAGLLRAVGENVFKRRVLVYGAGTRAQSIARLRRRAVQRGFRIVGFCRRLGVDEIVVAMDDRRRGFSVKDLLGCRLSNIGVVELESFLERETGRVRLDVLSASWMIFGSGFSCTLLRKFNARSFDIAASVLLLLLTWPIMLLTAIAIKMEDGFRAPVLYRQTRVGLEGRHFHMLKFRSMRIDAEQDGQPRWAQKGDERVTRVGAVARNFRIDELPQLLNVLVGDMRFVGPRPERPEFVELLSRKIPYYCERHCVKPGITGWAQLCLSYGASEESAVEKLEYDLYYAKNHCLLLDLSILVQTAEVVVWRKGAQ
jgi:exopolysaccharide biosynthesis polyprenyl glycosylphosphotransferase